MKKYYMYRTTKEGTHLNEKHAIFPRPIFDIILIIVSNIFECKSAVKRTRHYRRLQKYGQLPLHLHFDAHNWSYGKEHSDMRSSGNILWGLSLSVYCNIMYCVCNDIFFCKYATPRIQCKRARSKIECRKDIILTKHSCIQSGPKKCIHSLLINIFGINLNEISVSGWECNIMFSQQMAQALL